MRLALNAARTFLGRRVVPDRPHQLRKPVRWVDAALANRGHESKAIAGAAPGAELESRGAPSDGCGKRSVSTRWRDPGGRKTTITGRAEGRRMQLTGYPIETRLLLLPLREGHWPGQNEAGVVVINGTLQRRPRVASRQRNHGEVSPAETTVRVAGISMRSARRSFTRRFPSVEKITDWATNSLLLRSKPRRPSRVSPECWSGRLLDPVHPAFVSMKSEYRASLEEHLRWSAP